METNYNDLLEAANELISENENIDYTMHPELIPNDKEVWICCGDPEIDPLFYNCLLPKGTQDKTREMLKQIREEERLYIMRMREINKKLDQEYHDFFDKYDVPDDEPFNNDIDINWDNINTEQNDNDIPDICDSQDIIEENVQDEKPILTVYKDVLPNTSNVVLPQVNKPNNDILMPELSIDPNLSATKNFIKLLTHNESLLTNNQKLNFCRDTFTKAKLGISLKLLIPYSKDNSDRYIKGYSRYISTPITFNNRQWLLTNNIYKRNVEKLIQVLNEFIKENVDENSSHS